MRGGGSGQDADQGATDQPDRLTVQQAAKRLGVTQDAIRSRIKRGTLRSVHEGGRVYVLVGDQGATDQPDQPDQPTDQLVEALRDEISHLRRESERKDTIIMSLSQSNAELSRTIRAIEAPSEASPVPSQAPTEASEAPQTAAHEPPRAPWWRRWLG